MLAIASPWSAIWTIRARMNRAAEHDVDGSGEFVPVSRGAPRSARDIGLQARRAEDATLAGR